MFIRTWFFEGFPLQLRANALQFRIWTETTTTTINKTNKIQQRREITYDGQWACSMCIVLFGTWTHCFVYFYERWLSLLSLKTFTILFSSAIIFKTKKVIYCKSRLFVSGRKCRKKFTIFTFLQCRAKKWSNHWIQFAFDNNVFLCGHIQNIHEFIHLVK